MSEAELQEREQRRRARSGKACQAPDDPAHTLGNVSTMLVKLPGDVAWLDDGLKQKFEEYVGGLSVVNTIREEKVQAAKPYSRWTFSLGVHGVRFNSLLDVGDVREVARRLAERQTDKEGRPLETQIISASRGTLGIFPADTIEYRVESAQGPLHYLSLTSTLDSRLYNVTAQVPEDLWPELGPKTRDALASTNMCNKVSRLFAGTAGG